MYKIWKKKTKNIFESGGQKWTKLFVLYNASGLKVWWHIYTQTKLMFSRDTGISFISVCLSICVSAYVCLFVCVSICVQITSFCQSAGDGIKSHLVYHVLSVMRRPSSTLWLVYSLEATF